MVYERVRYLDIPADGGSIVSQADGDLPDTYGGEQLDGRIHKVWYDQEDIAANGSVWLLVSGTGEQIWYTEGGANADIFDYPRVQICDNASATQDATSGNNIWTEYVTRGLPLHVAGSGCGDTKVINKIRIWYY